MQDDIYTVIIEHLKQTLTPKLAEHFREILKEYRISETEVCIRYKTDQIDNLTGCDALDVIVRDIVPKLNLKSKTASCENK